MLFVFPRAQHQMFWMVDCVIDIDLMYLNSRGVVVGIHPMKKEPPQGQGETRDQYLARLKRYESRTPAKYVIELEYGAMERLGVRIGDQIELDHGKLGKLAR